MRQDRSRDTTPLDEHTDFYTRVGLLAQRCQGDAGLRERLAGDGGRVEYGEHGGVRGLGLDFRVLHRPRPP